MLSIIVAKSKNNVIGKDNKLIWSIPEDLKHFKNLTIGHNIIMGRKTFESLGRVLPNRKHIVLTKNIDFKVDNENVEIVHTIKEIEKYINDKEENFVIGGGAIYSLLLPYVTKMYVTEIDHKFQGDAFFPVIDENIWKVTSSEKGIKNEKNSLDYSFIIYEKK